MKMSDFQVLEFTGVQFLTFNVNSARSTGAELELFGKLSDHISANVSATYANSRYPSNCAVGVAAAALASNARLCGSTLTNAPKFAGVVGMTYDGPLNDSGWGLLVNGNINYSDRRRTQHHSARYQQPANPAGLSECLFQNERTYRADHARRAIHF